MSGRSDVPDQRHHGEGVGPRDGDWRSWGDDLGNPAVPEKHAATVNGESVFANLYFMSLSL